MGTKKVVGADKDPVVASLPLACTDEVSAVRFMEEQRGWHKQPECPRCESIQVARVKSPAHRPLWYCRSCKQQYTVRIGTVMEESRIPLKHWCYAFWRACTSKRGVSALEIKRQTGLSYRSSLFLMHRIRFAMSDDPAEEKPKMDGTIEVDSTFIGGSARKMGGPRMGKRYWNRRKMEVVALVNREGEVRTVTKPFGEERVTARTIKDIIRQNVDPRATVYTDDWKGYNHLEDDFPNHARINHGQRVYAIGDLHTNTVENFFGSLKRGMYGTFYSVSRRHLHRYVSEFAFRFANRRLDDGERTSLAIKKSEGKRLLYKQPVDTPLSENPPPPPSLT